MKTIILIGVFGLILASSTFADVAGTYNGSGTNPDGSKYDTKVIITKTGASFLVQWYFNDALGYEGVGIVKNKLLCVGFANPNGYGVVVYEIKSDDSLDGVWTGPGGGELKTEKLYKGEDKGEEI